jgi:hypothetical protein
MLLRRLLGFLLFLPLCFFSLAAQEAPATENLERHTIPDLLRRPQRGEAPRYPTDTVIGSLERGDVPVAAYSFAREVLAALLMESENAASLAAMNGADREKVFSDLGEINPRKFRLGSGREEADGAISFLIRFMGREKGISGELYVRAGLPPAAGDTEDGELQDDRPVWRLDDIILEEERSLDETVEGPVFNFPPYERFF